MERNQGNRAGAPRIPRTRENARLMRAHETMVDLISRDSFQGSFLDAVSSTFFNLDFRALRSIDAALHNDIVYSDSDDEYKDERGRLSLWLPNAEQRLLAPHPQIKQLTQEADRHALELCEEEERQKEKANKNKLKKLRKKGKKKVEKENAVKDKLAEEEQREEQSQSQPSESHKETPPKESNGAVPRRTQNKSVAAENAESSSCDDVEMIQQEEQKPKDDNNSIYSSPEHTAEEEPLKPPKTKRKVKQKIKTQVEVYQHHKKESEEPQFQTVKEETIIKEETTKTPTEDFSQKSTELACAGNRFAAGGQFEMAVQCFTEAIKYNPKEFKLFGNRSLCYERMQCYEKALLDADLALSMEPTWIKGLFRRGKALCGLKRYYEASLTYQKVLRTQNSSIEAAKELKRAQTLHLMEMGFSWAQSSEALKNHPTLEEAVDALFTCESTQERCSSNNSVELLEEEDDEWQHVPLPPGRGRRVLASNSSPRPLTPTLQNNLKPELFPVWVGSLAPTVTQLTLQSLFSRAGAVHSVKMLPQQCAFVHYTRKEDSEKAVQLMNGLLVEGTTLAVRFPNKIHSELGVSKWATTNSRARPASTSRNTQ